MAELSGKQALIEYGGGQVASFDDWNMTANTNMLDVTTFSTATLQWRDFIPGLSDWSGTISGNFDAASTGLTDLRTNFLTPTTGTIKLSMDKDGGESFTGTTYLSMMSHTAPIDGVVEVSLNYQGTSTLTFSTTT